MNKQRINMLLMKLSTKYEIFYLEKRTYRSGKQFKSYVISLGKFKKEFKREIDLLLWLKEMM